eukprot:SAG31_NODE_71_length_28115_cov_4.128105_8_plen_225_part_00
MAKGPEFEFRVAPACRPRRRVFARADPPTRQPAAAAAAARCARRSCQGCGAGLCPDCRSRLAAACRPIRASLARRRLARRQPSSSEGRAAPCCRLLPSRPGRAESAATHPRTAPPPCSACASPRPRPAARSASFCNGCHRPSALPPLPSTVRREQRALHTASAELRRGFSAASAGLGGQNVRPPAGIIRAAATGGGGGAVRPSGIPVLVTGYPNLDLVTGACKI